MNQKAIQQTGLLKSQGKAQKTLLQGRKKTNDNIDIAQIVAKRNADTVRFTHFMLKTRLANDLDATIGSHLTQNPQIKNKFFIAVITDDFSTEVVKKENVAASLLQGKNDPIGYFQKQNFPLETPDDTTYRSFKEKLDAYFKRNADVIQYLRDHPDDEVDPAQFRKLPSP